MHQQKNLTFLGLTIATAAFVVVVFAYRTTISIAKDTETAASQPNGPVSNKVTPSTQPAITPQKHKQATVLIVGKKHSDVFDCGYIIPEKKQQLSFIIKNPTNKSVKIKKVRSSCKCTTLVSPPTSIPASGLAKFVVDFVPPKKPTRYHSRIVLLTNSKTAPFISLQIKADVGLPLIATPETIDLGTIPKNSSQKTVITIHNRGNRPAKPAFSTSTATDCIATITGKAIPANGTIVIPVAFKTSKKPGTHKIGVTIHTNHPAQPSVKAQIQYIIPPK